jgi:hypothetical protein
MKWKSRITLVALVLVITSALTTAPALAATQTFTDRATGQTLHHIAGNDIKTSGIVDYTSYWQVITNGSYRLLKNTDNGRCLDSNANGQAYTNPCSTANNYQNWQVVPNGSYILLKDKATGRCLDSNLNGTVYTNPCSTSNHYQNWF